MDITFWGTRGSVASGLTNKELYAKLKNVLLKASPEDVESEEAVDRFLERLPFSDKKTLGGNTSCVEVVFGKTFLVLDAGSGLRLLGNALTEKYGPEIPFTIHIFLSHFHWDHIQGFPFFAPAFVKGNRIKLYSALEEAYQLLSRQQEASYFPVRFEDFGAEIEFVNFDADTSFAVEDVEIRALRLSHPGTSTGFRLSDGSTSLVYMSDTELVTLSSEEMERYRDFVRGADAVIVDSQYDFEESHRKKHWGHSSPFLFMDVLMGTGVKRVFLFHHDPGHTDKEIYRMHMRASKYKEYNYPDEMFDVLVAIEGDSYHF